jgi:3-deoxy-D-manno-octulosonic-acid transferase
MIRFLYNLLYPVALLLFLPGYLLKMYRRGNYRNKFAQRFGIYDPKTRARLARQPNTWMHAVSVGEVMIALKLADKMRVLEPDLSIALTTTTTTGFALARRQAPPWIETLYTPLDFWPIMRRAFAVIQPTRIVLVEAEVWPNLTAIAHRRRIPLALVNARLSPRSERRFQRFNRFVSPYFRKLDLVCAQEPEDVDRWRSLGAPSNRIQPVGSIKFDPEGDAPIPDRPRAVLHQLGIEENRPILLAGSTHPGEEAILARTFLELRREFAGLFLIIAPRHVERTRDIAAELKRLGLLVGRRSEPDPTLKLDCLLLDTTGELRDWFAVATIVFMGKSLTVHGGQNPVEPIVARRPVVFGPHMENFAALARSLIASGGARQCQNETSLTNEIRTLLRNPAEREELVARAQQVLDRHRGATTRTAELLHELRPRPG